MKYLLSDLLKVRSFRVDAALRKVVACREELMVCQRQRVKKQQELDDFTQYRLHREQSMYAEILGKTIRLAVLDDLKDAVRLMRIEQTAYEQQLLDAQRSVDGATEALRQAQEQHRKSLRAEEKLKQHQQLWLMDARRWQVLKEDAEIEDIPLRRRATHESLQKAKP